MVVKSDVSSSSALPDLADLRRAITLRGRDVGLLDVAAVLLVALGAAVQAVAVRTAGPVWPDVERQAGLVRLPLADAVLGAGTGPGPGGALTRAGSWFLGQVAPLQGGPVHALGVGLRAALALGVWVLLRRLLRASPALLVPVAVVAASPALVLAAADVSTVLGPLLAVTASVWCVVALHGTASPRRVAVAASLAAVAVLADRSGLALVAAVVCLVVADRWPGRAARRVSPVAALAAVAASAAVLAVPALRPDGLDALRSGVAPNVARAVVRAVTGGLVGAPWQWTAGPAAARAVPAVPDAATAAGIFVVCLALVLGARTSARRTLVGVVLGLACATAGVLLGAAGRPSATGALLWATLVLAVAAPLAVLRPRDPSPEDGPAPDDSPAPAADPAPVPLGVRLGLRPEDVVPTAVGAALALAVVATAVPSAVTLGRATASDPVRAWVTAARTSLDTLQPFPRVTSRLVPEAVTGPVRRRPLDTDVVRLARPDALVHDADGALVALDDTGRVSPATVATLGTSAPADFCAATVQPGPGGRSRDAVLALATPTPLPDDAQVRLELLVTGTTRIVAAVERTDGSSHPLQRWTDDVLYQGPHTVLLPVGADGTARAVRIGATAADAGLCVLSARVVRVP